MMAALVLRGVLLLLQACMNRLQSSSPDLAATVLSIKAGVVQFSLANR